MDKEKWYKGEGQVIYEVKQLSTHCRELGAYLPVCLLLISFQVK